MTKRICVTGASGRAGRVTVRELLEHGYQVVATATTFNQNMTMNFNVFTAAAQARLERVVWASSETTLGLPFDMPPRYAPVDEGHYPVPASTHALSKVAS